LNRKIVAVALLVLMSLAGALTPIAMVLGQNTTLGVGIIRVVPASQANSGVATTGTYTGSVGALFNIVGTIYVSNGPFRVIMNNQVLSSGVAQGYYVNSNFTVPQFPSGGYALLIQDVTENVNSTGQTPETFTITTSYLINPVSSYIQEGSSVALNVSITGAAAGTSYLADVSVELPSPLDANYSTIATLGTPNKLGTVNAQVTFPSSDFQPSSSAPNATDYAGVYHAYFNQSAALAQTQFSVGFLDSQTYHRGGTVTLNAIGYTSGEAATISIASVASGTSLIPPLTVNPSPEGAITTSWQVPPATAIGNYTVTISPTGTPKLVPDTEVFMVPGYPVEVKTVNLNGEAVPGILVQAQDTSTSTVSSGTSGSSGIATLKLEAGSYSFSASLKGVTVASQVTLTVSATSLSFNLVCQLTDLAITVQNENGTALPFVNLHIDYTYGSSQTANISAETGPSGTYTLNSTFTGSSVSYTIQASMYSRVFNSGNQSVGSLPAQATSHVVIICPTEPLTLNIVGYTNEPISGASLQLVELTNGLFYTATTDSSGSASIQVTFGMYKLQIYQNSILLNETTVDAFSSSQYQIRCTLYDIQVSVSVVDYFGSPISNANVTVNGPSSERFSAMTQGDGTTTFNNVIGGNLQVVAFAPGAKNNYQAVALTVDRPTSVQIKMDKFVALGPFLIPTSAFIAIIIILVAVIFLVVVEIYMRRRHRAKEP
jgi:hypothetical protein